MRAVFIALAIGCSAPATLPELVNVAFDVFSQSHMIVGKMCHCDGEAIDLLLHAD